MAIRSFASRAKNMYAYSCLYENQRGGQKALHIVSSISMFRSRSLLVDSKSLAPLSLEIIFTEKCYSSGTPQFRPHGNQCSSPVVCFVRAPLRYACEIIVIMCSDSAVSEKQNNRGRDSIALLATSASEMQGKHWKLHGMP